MKNLLLSTLLFAVAFSSNSPLPAQSLATASQPAASSGSLTGWARVQALAPNTSLHISARTHSTHCRLQSTDADTLTCLTNAKPETYQRADIKSIKIPHRTRSTIVGLAAGAGLGAIIGAASTGSGTGSFNIVSRGEVVAIFAIPLGLIGAIVGTLTDLTSSTVYRA